MALLLAVAVVAVFWPVLGHEFTNYDDEKYVTGNPQVRNGLTASGLRWAWTTFHAANWHPLTWMSHMLDWSLYGPAPWGHHLTSVLLHLANTLLLFLLFARMTGAVWRSALLALLFGVHPLHVESVAWAAERKDVLSTLFWLLAMGAYVRYARRPGTARYVLVAACLALGLTAKPMLVTVPLVLLLLDYWPLGRWDESGAGRPGGSPAWRLIREKLPLIPLVVASGAVTILAQSRGRAVGSLVEFPLGARVENAIASYVLYVWKAVWPRGLAVFYPHPRESLPLWHVFLAALALAGVTLLAVRVRRRHPYVLVGWLWYLGTLVPVIGIVQVGGQAMADRYTYVPLVGIFLIVAWGLPDAIVWLHSKLRPALQAGFAVARADRAARWLTGILGLPLMACAWLQIGVWRDSVTLFEHALAVTADNPLARTNLGLALVHRGQVDEGKAQYEQALRIEPRWPDARNNLGLLLVEAGRAEEGIRHLEEALRNRPEYPEALSNLGMGFAMLGRMPEAIASLRHALRLRPSYPEALNNLGRALLITGQVDEAITHLTEALRLQPAFAKAHNNLGRALAARGRAGEAIDHYTQAVRIDPEYAEAHNNLGIALASQGRVREAIEHYARALEIDPAYPEAHSNLGGALTEQGRVDEAIPHFAEAIRARPDYGIAHSNLAAALYSKREYLAAWNAIRAARSHGFEPPERLVRALTAQMREPAD